MEQPPSLPRAQRQPDADHLHLLSIFHYVIAGLALLGTLFIIAHYSIFHLIITNPKLWEDQKQGPPPMEIFAFFKWFYLIAAVWIVGSGILNLVAGLCIRTRKHRTFTMVVAGINCLHFPLGTALGVFTLIVLIRDSVREMYAA
jgi:hypothetical protein